MPTNKSQKLVTGISQNNVWGWVLQTPSATATLVSTRRSPYGDEICHHDWIAIILCIYSFIFCYKFYNFTTLPVGEVVLPSCGEVSLLLGPDMSPDIFKVRTYQTIWLARLRLIKASNLIGPIPLTLERFWEIFSFEGDKSSIPEILFVIDIFYIWVTRLVDY